MTADAFLDAGAYSCGNCEVLQLLFDPVHGADLLYFFCTEEIKSGQLLFMQMVLEKHDVAVTVCDLFTVLKIWLDSAVEYLDDETVAIVVLIAEAIHARRDVVCWDAENQRVWHLMLNTLEGTGAEARFLKEPIIDSE